MEVNFNAIVDTRFKTFLTIKVRYKNSSFYGFSMIIHIFYHSILVYEFQHIDLFLSLEEDLPDV